MQAGANLEMVRIDAIRESNAQAKCLDGLVAVFIGGTGGIGESSAKELFLRTTRPKAYIVGRSEERGNKICNELHEINGEGKAIFLQRDISLLKNCDELCAELREREPKIHCLFLTAGFMTLRGRNETTEGIDKKMAVNYYSRIRCILGLMPLLTAASEANELSRVISVLAAGSEGDVRIDDLDLKNNFTLHACLAHCVVMTDFCMEELAKRYPGTAFSHSYPGTVKTGIANELSGPVRLAVKVMYAVMTPWILNVQESGERHFFQMTSQCYPSRKGGVGIPPPPGLSAMRGTDFEPGSGAYLLDWDGKTTGDESVLRKYRDMGLGHKVWDHTMKIFTLAEQQMRKDSKRPAHSEAEGAGRSIPNPIGWRPAS
ncbi:hypothetical protein AC579_6177 [Pseudocercospora musae]|uniref:Ketoreductase (KR) domain-containing protein n=1 Tax=Pseudocercospora musae TaxID=113226 RepID=A0A139IS94_9PEZI|nr:hypothetical protein AC579_6177 [Pseudocercospora musae]KXT17565.1 hypothetical protein AC579_6177 [Pseudocercospora musae]